MKPINKIKKGEDERIYLQTVGEVGIRDYVEVTEMVDKINELIMNQNKMLKTLNLLSKAIKK